MLDRIYKGIYNLRQRRKNECTINEDLLNIDINNHKLSARDEQRYTVFQRNTELLTWEMLKMDEMIILLRDFL